jgi:uncharacterized Ntn-hydrolase superfamily protein
MTYSIIARDRSTGHMGVAIQSHSFSIATGPLWAEPGVGVVVTQMMIEPSYGPRGLSLMRAGASAADALAALIAADAAAATRQVAMLDAAGRAAVYTGAACLAAAGQSAGDGVSAQGTILSSERTPAAMLRAFEQARGDLAERLVAALDAGERTGGDLRGMRSAALLVVAAQDTGRPWIDRVVELSVPDHPAPLVELRRLVSLQRLFARAGRALETALAGDMAAGLVDYSALAREAPDDPDLAFRHGLLLALAGQPREARRRFDVCYRLHDGWVEAVRRLPAAGYLPDDPALLEEILPSRTR